MTTTLYRFGHTAGASSLLGLALAALPRLAPWVLELPATRAADGRRLLGGDGLASGRETLVFCRALGGACAAASLGGEGPAGASERPRRSWTSPGPGPPLQHPFLRRIAEEAPRHRPAEPPDLLIVRLAEPLQPPPRAIVGGRLLPSAVLEITPGRVAREIAGAWGFSGPALCLVGGDDPPWLSLEAEKSARRFPVVYIDPGRNHVEWS